MKLAFCVVAVIGLGVACAPQTKTAKAVLKPTEGHKVTGTVTFTQEADGVRIVAHVSGLTPGDHGFHIHEHGDCTAPDGSSAGGHFNPGGHRHGGPDSEERHAGDFGNITADANGHGHYDRLDKVIKLTGPEGIIGKSVIVHADPDDLVSQPTGNAGARVACGVIVKGR